jgi:hypothetical protein
MSHLQQIRQAPTTVRLALLLVVAMLVKAYTENGFTGVAVTLAIAVTLTVAFNSALRRRLGLSRR